MTSALAEGRAALGRGDWEAARTAYERAAAEAETPEALEGLGLAAWWLDDAATTFEARERAYRLYAEAGDRCGAARVAAAIAWDYQAFRGEPAVAQGWLQRARRQLEGLEPTPELGWVALREGSIALQRDTGEARQLAAEGAAIGRALGSIDLEMTGRALEGLALVSEGELDEGMRLLDEAAAAAVAGELTDLYAIGLTCCRLIAACQQVGDYDRAFQWCGRIAQFAERWRIRSLLAVCRTDYAALLLERGSWPEAEAELLEATSELAATRPAQTVAAVVRLAELRRRQGRRDEAAALFAQAEGHPLSLLGRAELALDRGDRAGAEELARSFLRRVPPQDRFARAAGLELLVRIDPASERARVALGDLQEIARQLATPPLVAAAVFAEALVTGERERLEEAIDLFDRAGQPFERARAQLELARLTGEERHRRAAQETLERLGVVRRPPGALTARELDVLRLIAEGLSDPEIAERLVISEHTVHRHVANIRTKLGQPSRAAAAVYAAINGLL
jgi:DNA-binding NarL/FixJ family response regulator